MYTSLLSSLTGGIGLAGEVAAAAPGDVGASTVGVDGSDTTDSR